MSKLRVKKNSEPEYLGDGVYIKRSESCANDIVLYTFDGLTVKNEIYIEPEVFQSMMRWIGSQYKVEIKVDGKS